MTDANKVYEAFLARILDDEWQASGMSEAEIQEDWYQLLCAAIPYFKFPRVSLELVEDGDTYKFQGDLSNSEISILANYMKCEWLSRTILKWDNIKPLYGERDFSQANMLEKLRKTLSTEMEAARLQESFYYRSVNGKPFDFTKMAGL